MSWDGDLPLATILETCVGGRQIVDLPKTEVNDSHVPEDLLYDFAGETFSTDDTKPRLVNFKGYLNDPFIKSPY